MIDVIIPTYNRVASLKKVIDSYLLQPERGVIVIVDDWSTDDTKRWADDLALHYPGVIRYIKPETKKTMPELRNIGVAACKSEYIFMGEDDVLLPKDHFNILLAKMRDYHADIIAGRRLDLYPGETMEACIARSNADRDPMYIRVPFEAYFDRYIDTPKSVLYVHSNALMNRKVFDAVQYDPQFGARSFVFREETDFFMRAQAAGCSIWMIPDTLSFHLKNMSENKTGGSRRSRIVFEYLVWKNTIKFFLKNRVLFKKEVGVQHIYWFALRCLVMRYWYALYRRIKRMVRNRYEKA
jgi:glycosyltransferase involved in cell wall biosynthesis